MDHSWRPRPPIQGNICPTCSNTHFPFCPPPLSFTENPRFQSNNDKFSYRPPYDPFFDHRGPTVNLHRPFVGNPSDGFGDRQPWHRSPSLDRDPYGQFHGPSQIGDTPMVNVVYSDGFGPPSYDHGAVGFKRMRVNERESSTFIDENTINSSRITWEDERRLKLIREHGSLPSDTNAKLNPTMKFETKGFQNSDIGYFDSKGTSFPPKLGSYPSKYKEEDGLPFEQHSILTNMNDEIEKSQYYREDCPDGYTAAELAQQSQSVPYSNFDARNENYYQDHHLQRIQPSDSMVKESPYSQYPMQPNHDFHRLGQFGSFRQSVGVNDQSQDGIQGQQKFPVPSLYARSNLNEQGGYVGPNVGPTSHAFLNAQPPLPTSPPPPLPLEPQGLQYFEPFVSSPSPKTPSSLFPVQVAVSSLADVTMTSSHSPVPPEAYSVTHNYYSKALPHTPTGFSPEEFQVRPVSSKKYLGDNQTFPLRHLSSDKPKPVDASHIFKQPHRATRPDRIVVILRGLPGSGKSYLAKMLRDLEVENGGDAPRIHSMDDYFMTEVEKAEESDGSKSSGSARGKKRVMKKVMEYCYEPEMEEAYRSSMLKAFTKTLDEGVFSFIIVDDRNLRVADFAQFWATAKRSGYEVYLLEATYKDPVGCAARNVHSFTQDDIERMAGTWEEAPSLYLKLDVKPLLHGYHLEESGIQEVDMDTEDADPAGDLSGPDDGNLENAGVSHPEEFNDDLSKNDESRWYGEKGGHSTEEEVKELRKSKWSDDVDEDDDSQRTEGKRGNSSALSGLIQAYSKEGKSVRWGDQVGNTGFSIGGAKREKAISLVIGPGAGYNLKSNPLAEEEKKSGGGGGGFSSGESNKQNIFQEQMRAERESFKAVFDKRRHRISGLHLDDE